MAKIRDTINRLMALALADIPEEDTARANEARNAAVQALKLIDEHKLLDGGSGKKLELPFELTTFDVESMLQKLYIMDFDGVVAMVERFKRRTERISAQRKKNYDRDFQENATWTEKVTHSARRAGRSEQCSYCGEEILM